jgi:hypothetical protein
MVRACQAWPQGIKSKRPGDWAFRAQCQCRSCWPRYQVPPPKSGRVESIPRWDQWCNGDRLINKEYCFHEIRSLLSS